jgi:phosphatidate cytidylyltransferase
LLGGIGALIVLRLILVPSLPLSYSILLGAGIGIVTVIGDLVESMFKRDAGVKDSGVVVPGHGGILDKIDGALFTGPFVYWTLKVTGVLP